MCSLHGEEEEEAACPLAGQVGRVGDVEGRTHTQPTAAAAAAGHRSQHSRGRCQGCVCERERGPLCS